MFVGIGRFKNRRPEFSGAISGNQLKNDFGKLVSGRY